MVVSTIAGGYRTPPLQCLQQICFWAYAILLYIYGNFYCALQVAEDSDYYMKKQHSTIFRYYAEYKRKFLNHLLVIIWLSEPHLEVYKPSLQHFFFNLNLLDLSLCLLQSFRLKFRGLE